MRIVLLGAVMSASMMFAQGASAAAPLFTPGTVSTACSGGVAVDCLAAINAIIADLQTKGLTPGQLNFQIGLLASTLADVARNNPSATVLAAISAALGPVAAASSDPAQQAAIALLATDVSNNSVPAQTDFTTSFNLSDA